VADQPKAMTLREAVEIERRGPPNLGDYGGSPDSFLIFSADADRWYRARAIVDAAVEAHEKRIDFAERHIIGAARPCGDAFRKLRAIERGEEA
jgi:hypothetical protein